MRRFRILHIAILSQSFAFEKKREFINADPQSTTIPNLLASVILLLFN